MNLYLIILACFSFTISLCQVLSLGKLIRLWQHKKLRPYATLKDIESFEKNTKWECNCSSAKKYLDKK